MTRVDLQNRNPDWKFMFYGEDIITATYKNGFSMRISYGVTKIPVAKNIPQVHKVLGDISDYINGNTTLPF